MKILKGSMTKILVVVLFIETFLLAGTVAIAAPAISHVIVDNFPYLFDTSGNLKVANQGTSDVNVTNASIPVSGTVSVTGTPDVNVTNSPDNPVLSQDVDDPARNSFSSAPDPFSALFDLEVSVDADLPVGYNVAIEFISASIVVPHDNVVYAATLALPTGTPAPELIALTLNGPTTDGFNDYYTVSQPVKAYVDSDRSGPVTLSVSRSFPLSEGPMSVRLFVSGYSLR